MGLLDSVLKAFVGDKSQKDIGEIQPIVNQIKSFEEALKALSLDALRAKTDAFKKIIQDEQATHTSTLQQLKEAVDKEEDIDQKMLKTIKFPPNLKNLNENLPKPKYESKCKTSKVLPDIE